MGFLIMKRKLTVAERCFIFNDSGKVVCERRPPLPDGTETDDGVVE
jgi:hypothetical protein